MLLTKATIRKISARPGLIIPDEKLFSLPEKVLQFGTGVLLRGLPDYFIDKANRQGVFNGRVLVVKSTGGAADDFDKQDGLYSLCIRGMENGKKIDETIINCAISRVLSARENWDSVLQAAENPELKVIISNTTEVGITLVQDDVRMYPPLSFPGKLLAFLFARFRHFKGSKESGMIIIPTELITDNAKTLRNILLELAGMNKLEEGFTRWLSESNHFCNSLVDRIVPGKLPDTDRISMEGKLGYNDELMIMAESFRLWAIESESKEVETTLSFSKVDEGVVLAPDIEKYRELKLRLLNGTHSFSCGLAHLAGFTTVREAMTSKYMSAFINNLAQHEIVQAITSKEITASEASAFALKTLDRFRNPYLDHGWLNICLQYSTKMKMRNVPLLMRHYERTNQVPECMALGFAAFILFMKGSPSNGKEYKIEDEHAAWFASKWKTAGNDKIVSMVLSDREFWGEDLSALPGFEEAVNAQLQSLIKDGAMSVLRRVQLHKPVV
jgi:tagaturonate reductase